MVKIQKLRFVTEVAPPKFLSLIKRPLIKILETINEEEAYVSSLSSSFVKPKDQA